jgi:cation diffusion facilitator family transporter
MTDREPPGGPGRPAGRDPHGRGHGRGYPHPDSHTHPHDHDYHQGGWRDRVAHRLRPHSHDSADKVDAALEGSAAGLRVLWVSVLVLLTTAVFQAVVVAWSGSVALLGDTVHNAADSLTAAPLWLAFLAGRRPPNSRYTYGYGRAEDLAGLAVVLVITASCAFTAYAAVRRLAHPQHVSHLAAVAVAALVGFAGNEIVARYRITVGRRIGSAALVADGLHARTDGFTSIAVLLGAAGVAAGWKWADPVVGLGITVAILFVLRDAAQEVYRRLMDAVDPTLVGQAERSLAATEGVERVGRVRLRWIGHQLYADAEIVLDPQLTLVAAHQVAIEAEHRLLHEVPRLRGALIHPDPRSTAEHDPHQVTAHHRAAR